jgi:hypothetical protein
MKIKKLKNDKKVLENKLEQIQKETSNSSGVKIQVVEKGTNTHPIHIATQEDANPVEEKTYRDVGVQTLKIPSVLTSKDSSINNATSVHKEKKTPKENQENVTSIDDFKGEISLMGEIKGLQFFIGRIFCIRVIFLNLYH